MPTIKITGGEKCFVSKAQAAKIREIKYGKNGSTPAPANTPITIDGFGTLEARDVRIILDRDDHPSTTTEEQFVEEEVRSFEQELKKFKDFDDYCISAGFIRKNEDGNVVVIRELVPQYNEARAKHKLVSELRRKREFAKRKTSENFNNYNYQF